MCVCTCVSGRVHPTATSSLQTNASKPPVELLCSSRHYRLSHYRQFALADFLSLFASYTVFLCNSCHPSGSARDSIIASKVIRERRMPFIQKLIALR